MTLPSALYARVHHRFTGTGAPFGAEVTYAVELDVGTFTTPLALATVLHDIWEANMLPQQSGAIALVSTLVKRGPDLTGPSAEYAESDNGSLSGASSPPSLSYLVHKFTAGGGRRAKGRMYVPGLLEADTAEGGGIASARQTSFNTALQAWFTAVNGAVGVVNMVLEHDPPKPGTVNPSPQPAVPTTVTGVALDATAATQRRRMRR